MSTRTLRSALLLTLCLAAPAPAAAEVSVQMTAQPREVSVGGEVMVRIQVSADSLGGPEVKLPSFDDFEITQRSVSRPMQFNFGLGGQSVRSQAIYTFVLRPLRTGRLTIEPTVAKVDGQTVRSDSLTVDVSEGPAGGGRAPQPAPPGGPARPPPGAAPAAQAGDYADAAEVDPVAFIRTVVDKPRPFVHEQVTATVYLYTREPLREAPAIELEPSTDGFWTHDLMANYQLRPVDRQVVGRVRYTVYLLRRFAAFPLTPGPATIGPLALTISRASLLDSFFGRAPRGPVERRGLPVELEVQALPEGGPDPATVLVGKVQLEARLDRNQVATGDAVTLTATLRGSGQLQTVQLDKPVIDGVDVFDPQVRDLVEAPDGLVGGTRIYEWLLVPRAPGQFTVPAMVVKTFDARSGRYGEARSTALTLTAAGQATATPTAPEPAAGGQNEDVGAERPSAREALNLPPIRRNSALSRHTAALYQMPGYWALLGAAPALWLLLLLLRRVRTVLAARAAGGAGHTTREVKSHLDAARFAAGTDDARATYAAIAAALETAIEGALGQAIGSHTRPQLDRLLSDRGLDAPVRKAVLDALERCDFARFSADAVGAGTLQQAIAEARELTRSLARMGGAR